MNRLYQFQFFQLIFGTAISAVTLTALAQPSSTAISRSEMARSGVATNHIATQLPLPPLPQSPVLFFRKLLAMTPPERTLTLTNRTPEARARILAKVREYQSLNPDERELRLRATDLRWYLSSLFRIAPADREARLDQVPTELRDLVKSRLSEWDALPPSLQQELLENDKTLHYFARTETTNSAPLDAEHQKIADQFNQFFVLTPEEQSQCLPTLSDAERAQMAKTLESFQGLPVQKRSACIRNYARFAGMSAAERADFLKNAERWSQMSPKERQAWRDLVAQMPEWPVVAPTIPANLIPHSAAKADRPAMATNIN